jgi:hypothetical protein
VEWQKTKQREKGLNKASGSARLINIMKMKLLKPVLVIAGASFLLTGCIVRERTVYSSPPPAGGPAVADSTTEVEVTGPPPPDQVEVVGVAPGPGVIWIGGFWGWGPGGWAWHRGYWGRPPHPGARWFGPRYVYRGGRHIWVRGGWR